ncbi:MAG TPA: VIT domain-containing protein, partial [Phycisphaerae bacterium]|nr:VIT domain-containing protein [Phycisphaerae bacterium]
LPADASISRFAMWVGDVLMEGEVVERMRAREVYESIVRRKRDPALLEWMGGNQFKARVFPIEPNSTKHVILGYTQVLPLEGDLVRYVYPLKSEKLTKNPLNRLQIELNAWSMPAMAGFDSPSHVCGLAADAHHGRAIFQAENYLPTRDFIVTWQVTGRQAELYCVPHWRADDHGYFLAFVSPREIGAVEDSAKQAGAEDVLLMVDTSGSVAGDDWTAAKRVAATWLNFLGEHDRFNLLMFDLEPRPAFPLFVENTPENRQLAGELLDEVEPFGASDVARAIESAASLLTAREGDAVPARIIFIGDGVSTIGKTEPAQLLESAAAAFRGIDLTASTMAIGSEYDAAFIEGFARQFDGAAKVVSSSQQIEETVAEMVDDSFKPMITNLALSFEGIEASQVYPATLPNVLAGGQVIVAGRYDKPGTGRMVLTGLCGADAYRREIDVTLAAEKNENTFVPRLWARRCMDDLLHRIGVGADGVRPGLVAQVIDLSQTYKLMSPYTSFLVLETEEDYQRFGIDRRFSMEQWTGEPAGPEAPGEQMEMAAAKPAAPMQFALQSKAEAMGTSYLGGELHDEYLGEESLQTEMDAAFKDAEWAESEAGDMLLAANEPMDMRSRSDSSFSMDWQMPQNTPRRKSAISMGGSGAYGSRGGGGGSYPRQGRRSTVLYPAAEARRQTAGQQPPQPAIDADVRAVVETFAKGPTDFRFRSVTTNYAKNGKVESRSESLRAAVGKRFVREYSSEGEVTSRTLCDGDLVYICHEHTQYAAAR